MTVKQTEIDYHMTNARAKVVVGVYQPDDMSTIAIVSVSYVYVYIIQVHICVQSVVVLPDQTAQNEQKKTISRGDISRRGG